MDVTTPIRRLSRGHVSPDAAADHPLASSRLGVGWLAAWLLGALMAWLLPWLPSSSTASAVPEVHGWVATLSWLRAHLIAVPGMDGPVLPFRLLAVWLLSVALIQRRTDMAGSGPRWAGLLLGAAFVVGLCWSLSAITAFRQQLLPPGQARIDAVVEGQIIGLPVQRGGHRRFVFRLGHVIAGSAGIERLAPGSLLLLNDYGHHRPTGDRLRGGHAYRLSVRLKPPHGSANPGGFDYERWLFRHQYVATGYLRGAAKQQAPPASGWLDRLRSDLRAQLLARAGTAAPAGRGMLLGLTLGDRSFLPQADWSVLLATGTNHLLAISGLHVGLIAGLFAWLASAFWRRRAWCEAIPAQRMAALAAMLAAWGYALIAGMSIPTERAALMISIMLAGVLLGRSWRLIDLWLLAAMVILLIDPFAPLSAGFWLSFLAVLVIVLWVRQRRSRAFWWRMIELQLILMLALWPIVWWLFGRIAWASLPANLLAVPLVSLVITPLALATLLFLGWAPVVVDLIVRVIDELATGLFTVLNGLAGYLPSTLVAPPPLVLLLPVVVGVAWLLMPRKWPMRYLGVLCCLPALAYRPELPPEGQAEIWLFDVGQGLACLVRTHDHALLYDTGPAFGQWDAGARTVLPALRDLGVERVDRIVISHAARDHDGGLASVKAAFTGADLISGEPLPGFQARTCQDGMNWRWDGVRFELLHAAAQSDDNDKSCVLSVRGHFGRTLLTGDIEAPAEHWLLHKHDLHARWLYVPHHGSRTSSTAAFIDAVAPQAALISAGYLNRFGHPAGGVVSRYQRRGIAMLETARGGAIQIAGGRVEAYRAGQWPFAWRQRMAPRSAEKKAGTKKPDR